MNYWLHLLVEAVLYYVACSLVSRTREEAPGLLRIFIVVLLLAVISGGVAVQHWDFWSSSVIVFLLQFIILWIGLGIGLFRTIIAALIVIFLRSLMEAVFSTAHETPRLFT